MVREIAVPSTGQAFKNNATVCVGTGRMGLALQKEYYEHLKLVQEKSGSSISAATASSR